MVFGTGGSPIILTLIAEEGRRIARLLEFLKYGVRSDFAHRSKRTSNLSRSAHKPHAMSKGDAIEPSTDDQGSMMPCDRRRESTQCCCQQTLLNSL